MKNKYQAPSTLISVAEIETLLNSTSSMPVIGEEETGTNNGGADEVTDKGFKGLSRHHDLWEDEEEEEE